MRPLVSPAVKPAVRQPSSGDLLHVTRGASVQFIRPILFRVIRVLDWTTYDGWLWIDGYELDAKGEAMSRRSLFVQPAGLRWAVQPPAAVRQARRQPGRRTPVRV